MDLNYVLNFFLIRDFHRYANSDDPLLMSSPRPHIKNRCKNLTNYFWCGSAMCSACQAENRLEVLSDNAKAGNTLRSHIVVAENEVVLDSIGVCAPDVLPEGASIGDTWDSRAVAGSRDGPSGFCDIEGCAGFVLLDVALCERDGLVEGLLGDFDGFVLVVGVCVHADEVYCFDHSCVCIFGPGF